ncbi:FAD:protein FMN transferase [Alicyclobacillaceae bacterium I2511]|nr:FAD:protein FMN transferase [Alicyclobacillaceae bacterium I2511]
MAVHSRKQSRLCMGTVVSIKVVSTLPNQRIDQALEKSFEAIQFVESMCTRFSENSPLRRLATRIGVPVEVPTILYEAIRFALEVAHWTDGAFDPTVGHVMEQHGFHHHYLTGDRVRPLTDTPASVSYRDVLLDEDKRTVLLQKPLLLDLGAVAKGLAVDLAAKELQQFDGFAINAGGDAYLHGKNEYGLNWNVGITHPVHKQQTIATLEITDMAVCTSGSYERISPSTANTHHLVDGRTGVSPTELVSCTVLAPYAMLADALSTAAFVLGKDRGMHQLAEMNLEGLFVTSTLEVHHTTQIKEFIHERAN